MQSNWGSNMQLMHTGYEGIEAIKVQRKRCRYRGMLDLRERRFRKLRGEWRSGHPGTQSGALAVGNAVGGISNPKKLAIRASFLARELLSVVVALSDQARSTSQATQESCEVYMAKLRERQPCRRGPQRGSSSRRPAADEHHHCCCCYCHRRARAIPLPAAQFLEVGGAREGGPMLPVFGSVIFTLGGSADNAGLNAHVSVLFTKLPEGTEAGNQQGTLETPQGNSGGEASAVPPPLPPGGSGEVVTAVQPSMEASTKGKEPMQGPSHAMGLAPPGIDEEKWRSMWEGVEEGHGWAYIKEDTSLCEDAEAHLEATLRPPSPRFQD